MKKTIYFIDCENLKDGINNHKFNCRDIQAECDFYELSESVSWGAADIIIIGSETENYGTGDLIEDCGYNYNDYDSLGEQRNAIERQNKHFTCEINKSLTCNTKLIICFGISDILRTTGIYTNSKHEPRPCIEKNNIPKDLNIFCNKFVTFFDCRVMFITSEFSIDLDVFGKLDINNVTPIIVSHLVSSKSENYGFYNQNFIVLPKLDFKNIIADNKIQELLVGIISIYENFIPRSSQQDKKNKTVISRPDWVNKYKLPQLAYVEERLNINKQQIEILLQKQERFIQDININKKLEYLLYGEDDCLVESIAEFLKIFGCYDIKMNQHFDPDIEIDLLFTIDNTRFIGEVKGKIHKDGTNTIVSKEISQLQSNYSFYCEIEEAQDYDSIIPIIFGNIGRDIEPEDRVDDIIHVNALKRFSRFNPIKIKTHDLYDFMKKWQETESLEQHDQYKQEIISKLFFS